MKWILFSGPSLSPYCSSPFLHAQLLRAVSGALLQSARSHRCPAQLINSSQQKIVVITARGAGGRPAGLGAHSFPARGRHRPGVSISPSSHVEVTGAGNRGQLSPLQPGSVATSTPSCTQFFKLATPLSAREPSEPPETTRSAASLCATGGSGWPGGAGSLATCSPNVCSTTEAPGLEPEAPRGRAWAGLWHRGLCSRHPVTTSHGRAGRGGGTGRAMLGAPRHSPAPTLTHTPWGRGSCAPGAVLGPQRRRAGISPVPPRRASRAQRRDSRGAGGILPWTRLRILYMPLIFFLLFHLTPERVQTHRL